MAENMTLGARVAEKFKDGCSPAHVAEEFGVARQTAYRWRKKWKERGADGLSRIGRRGRPARVEGSVLARLEHILLEDPRQFSYKDGRWTLSRIASVWDKNFRIQYSKAQVSRILRRLGWQYSRYGRTWRPPNPQADVKKGLNPRTASGVTPDAKRGT